MSTYNLFHSHVEIDEAATQSWYADAEGWSCICGHCRNFLELARTRELPPPVLEVLDSLKIPPEKPTYVCEIHPCETGHLYQFSYRVAGRILSGEGRILSGDKAATPSQQWGSAYCCHEPYPYGAPDFPTPHFDLEFWVTLPWVLDEPGH